MFYFLHPVNVTSYPGLQEEIDIAIKYLGKHSVGTNIVHIPENSTVITRYRSLPFGQELENEIQSLGSTTINSYKQHRNIANLFNWVNILEGFTAPAYSVDDIPYLDEGEWFVKGETNSKKNQWFDYCYAPNKKELMRVVRNNMNDSMIGYQDIAIRPFQKFRKLATSVDKRPVFNERRVFVFNGEILSVGDYWSSQPEVLDTVALDNKKFDETLTKVIELTKELANFYVIDMAEYDNGDWAVVELNDGCMSGISENDPEILWNNLFNSYSHL